MFDDKARFRHRQRFTGVPAAAALKFGWILAGLAIFWAHEQELFSRVVPGSDPFAATIHASRLVTGISARMASDELARRIGLAWEQLPEPRHPFSLEIISPDRKPTFVNLGPHPPRLWPEDVDRLHDIWLTLTETEGLGAKLHHRDVLGVALRRLEQELTSSEEKEEILALIREELRRG